VWDEETNGMRVLVLGGTGLIGRAVVDRLLVENHDVVLFDMRDASPLFGGGLELILGDRSNREAFKAGMQKESFDAVIDLICFNEKDARSTVDTFRGSTGQMIICSSAAVYRRPFKTVPTIEEAEDLFDNPEFGYAFHKAKMERYLHRTIQEENLPITIIRPSLTFGPGSANFGVLRQNYGVVDRIRKDKPLIMFGDGRILYSMTFSPDVAKAFSGVLGNEKTYGQAYHVSSEERHLFEDLYWELGKILGKEPQIVHVPSELLYKADPDLFGHVFFEKSYGGLYDNTKLRTVVAQFRAGISLNEGLQGLLEWFEKELRTVDPEKDALEERLVSIHNHWAERMSPQALKGS
jgi:nucleoside-diphosphate-sugar epimerase